MVLAFLRMDYVLLENESSDEIHWLFLQRGALNCMELVRLSQPVRNVIIQEIILSNILFGGFWVEMVAFRENLYNLAPQDGNATLHLQH